MEQNKCHWKLLNFAFSFKLTFLVWQQYSLLVDWHSQIVNRSEKSSENLTTRDKKKSLVVENDRKISNRLILENWQIWKLCILTFLKCNIFLLSSNIDMCLLHYNFLFWLVISCLEVFLDHSRRVKLFDASTSTLYLPFLKFLHPHFYPTPL